MKISTRWRILALLFGVRMVMAFQFQAVAALSPFIMEEFRADIADIGLLIGLYLSPGVLLAYPGGAIGKRFGAKAVVLAGLVLMMAGGLIVALSSAWEMQVAGRVIAGVGGVLLNVLMTKMVTDWFAGREIATAMGIFVNSWPFGIALALLLLPGLAEVTSLSLALLTVFGLTVLGFAALAAGYRPPEGIESAGVAQVRLRGLALRGVVLAGSIWGLYNAALGMIFGFAPAMLVEWGWSATSASSVTSLVLWVVALSVPLGGIIADRSRQADAVLLTGLLLFAIIFLVAARADHVLMTFVALGIVAGLPAGPIMSLPSRVLSPGNSAVGMGLFYAIFYLFVVLAPLMAGLLAEVVGRVSVAFDAGAFMLVCSALLALVFKQLAASRTAREEPPCA